MNLVNLPPVLTVGGLDVPFDSIQLKDAHELLSARYGISGDLRRFATEKDDTFHVRCSDGRSFVLKVSNPGESIDEIDFQLGLLLHIAKSRPDLPVPRVLLDTEGRSCSKYIGADNRSRVVRMLSYIDGIPLDRTQSSQVERERIGEVLAGLRLATASFSHPFDRRDLAWDVRHLPQMIVLLNEIQDSSQRDQIAAAISRFEFTTASLPRLRSQVVHNDFSKSNIIVDHNDPRFVNGIIDFGDAVHTAIAIDVSTALLNQLPGTPVDDPFADGRDLLRGYLRQADLTEEELAMIPHLTMGRVVLRILLTKWRARLFPDNSEYILRNTPQSWWQLKWFLERSINEVSASLSAL